MRCLDRLSLPGKSTGGLLVAMPVMLVVVASLVLSLIPGMPRGAVFAHEWGTARVAVPLRLPVLRPLHLRQGERVHLYYAADIRAGRLALRVRRAGDPLSIVIDAQEDDVFSLTESGEGAVSFIAPHAGFYLFFPGLRAEGEMAEACKGPAADLLDAVLARRTACPIYDISYRLMIF